MLTDAVEVAAMTQAGLRAILFITTHALHLRIVASTLCKTVGHEHIEHIGIGETHALVATHLTGLELIHDFLTF